MRLMGRALVALSCAALVTGGAVVGQRRNHPAGPDAFLNFQVDSTSELVAELRNNRTLRQRYAKHFGIQESEVVDFVKNSLVPYRLPESRVVTVYGVNKNGRIYGVRQRMRKGTRVWATRSGEPVLKWLCANPMTRRLPRMASAPIVARPKPPTPRVAALPVDVEQVAPSVETFVAAPPATPTAVAPVPVPPPVVVPVPPVASVPIVTGGGGGGGFLPLAFLPLLGLGGGGDDEQEPGPGPTVTPGPGPSEVIPEPGSMALLALAAPVIGVYVRRRSRRRNDG